MAASLKGVYISAFFIQNKGTLKQDPGGILNGIQAGSKEPAIQERKASSAIVKKKKDINLKGRKNSLFDRYQT